MRDYKTEAINMVKTFDTIGMDTRVAPVARRLIEGNVFPSDKELWEAIYYLTDEDYAENRSALLFFASKLA